MRCVLELLPQITSFFPKQRKVEGSPGPVKLDFVTVYALNGMSDWNPAGGDP